MINQSKASLFEKSTGNRSGTIFKRQVFQFFQHGDLLWKVLLGVITLIVLGLMLSIGWMLWQTSADARQLFGINFITPVVDASWDPVNDQFQAWPFIYGTFLTAVTAIILAVPISLGIAIFLAEICPESLRVPLNWLIELLAAIPSVVYGLWGTVCFSSDRCCAPGEFPGWNSRSGSFTG